MSFGNARGVGPRTSASRAIGRTLAILPTREQMERLIAREVARAERTGQHFALALFRVRRCGRLGMAERRLALTLLRRARLTDEVGWFNDEHLCALLPDTSAAGARIFVDSACELVARKCPRPTVQLYTYPGDWIGKPDAADAAPARNGDERRTADTPRPAHAGHAGPWLGLVGGANSHAQANGHSHSNGHNHEQGHGHVHGPVNGNGNVHSHGPVYANEGGPALAVTCEEEEQADPVLSLSGAADRASASGNSGESDLLVIAPPHQASTPAFEPPQVDSLHTLLVRPMPWWKRAIDICGAAFGLLLLSPLLLTVALLIKWSSPGPVLFIQRRAGLGGRPFRIFKFRTMVVDAEAKKAALRKFSEQDGPAFKLTNDPRITGIGRLLRKTSLDEMPQLWNVLKGDMSLVGPRPLPIDEADACERWQKRRLDVTPGLTCIWQIAGRSEVTFPEWVRMDVKYMRRRTIFHDLAILFKTVPAVLLRRGAK